MNNLRKKILTLCLITALFSVPMISFAQIDPGCDPDDPACPIDGGIGLLIAAGIGLGAKKAYQQQKKSISKY